MIKTDAHMHTGFSSDSESTPESMLDAAIALGLDTVCFTDHYDKDNLDWGPEDIFVPEDYLRKMHALRTEYEGKIQVNIGVEIGIQPHLGAYYKDFLEKYSFDFVIGSAHSIERHDVATKIIFDHYTSEEAYHRVFQETLEDIMVFDGFDVLGHLDYSVRYGEKGVYSYKKYADEIDAILRRLIERGKGIELNTSGLKYGLGFPHPHMDVLKRYRELGGEILTVGADGHKPEHIAYAFERAEEILLACGFKYYTIFSDREPVFCKIK